jgi:hypothetical protein
MNMRLNKIQIENFKGIKAFDADFDGENATIKAANGIGKTTIYDAFLWLLFNKDSAGKKDFELRPLDDDNQPISGLTLLVAAEIDIDGVTHILRKQHEEKVVKGQLRGFETLCFVDDVPKKVGEFQEYISELIPEDTFKLLTSLRHFNEGLHWKDRRSVLLEIAGEIETPKGFDHLLSQLKGRSLDDYKKVLADQKKRLTKERDEISPRIDELQRGSVDYAGKDTAPVIQLRELAKKELAGLDKQRADLFASEKARQLKIDQLNVLKSQFGYRERQLASDTGGIQHLLDEKKTIELAVSEKHGKVLLAEKMLHMKESELSSVRLGLENHMRMLAGIREEYGQVSAKSDPCNCSLCGQVLPADKMAEVNKRKEQKLAEIIARGNTTKASVDAQKQKASAIESELKALKDELEKAKIELAESEAYRTQRIAEIDNLASHNKTISPDQDPVCLDIKHKIECLSGEIGEPLANQLQVIETESQAKKAEIDEYNQILARADRAKQDAERIKELEAKENEIAQQIADIDGLLASIEAYRAAESGLIEAAVNDKFKLVKFKMFTQLLNGGMEESCEAMLNGVPYSDCSYGQKAVMGIDIVNTLSAHYGVSVPLVVDNAESITYPIEFSGQLISLVAQKNVKKLTIDKKGVVANV